MIVRIYFVIDQSTTMPWLSQYSFAAKVAAHPTAGAAAKGASTPEQANTNADPHKIPLRVENFNPPLTVSI